MKTRSAVCTAPRRDDGHRHRRSSERETTAANGDGEGGADRSLGDSSLVENVRFGGEELFVFDDFVRSLSALWVVNRQKTNMRFGSFVRSFVRSFASTERHAPSPHFMSAVSPVVTIAPRVRFAALSSRRGSGTIVEHDGRVIVATAAHVASMAGRRNELTLTMRDGSTSTATARVVGMHATLDLAVCEILECSSSAREAFERAAAEVERGLPLQGEGVRALGEPQGYARVASAIARLGRGASASSSRGIIVGVTKSGTHVMHSGAVVTAGMSGGPLLSVATGKVLGVHSFGDAFYGGERDVAVSLASLGAIERFDASRGGVDVEAYETAAVNARIFASSDVALEELAPTLTPEQRASWIL